MHQNRKVQFRESLEKASLSGRSTFYVSNEHYNFLIKIRNSDEIENFSINRYKVKK